MRTTVITAIATMAVAGTAAAKMHTTPAGFAPKYTITAYVRDDRTDHALSLGAAEPVASQIFATAGVAVNWRLGWPETEPKPADLTVLIDLKDQTPAERMPGALAYALPYEGVHLIVFCDRVVKMNPSGPQVVMGHVLAHEITHLLEGIQRHSETGVMKAHYSNSDIFQMSAHPLPFAPEDLALIQTGIERRLTDAVPVVATAATGEQR
jgi:hypothetical protein